MSENSENPDKNEWPDLAGRIVGSRHILPVRVYFEDTDFSGVVYHANYLKFCERGRSDFVRLLGVQHNELLFPEDGVGAAVFVVRSIELDYLASARIDDLLVVTTEINNISGATVTLDQTVSRDQKILVKARVKVVLISEQGKPQRLGKKIKEAFQSTNKFDDP